MKIVVWLVCFCIICINIIASQKQVDARAFIPTQDLPVAAFIPPGYALFPSGQAMGDLNDDGRSDVVLVLRLQDSLATTLLRPKRLLLVLWGTATGYRLAARASHAVMGVGGMDREMFSRVLIRRGTLMLDHYSASNWFWRIHTIFRYQTGAFYRIGETIEAGRTGGNCIGLTGPAGWQYQDANFVTGTQESWRISEDCHLLEHKQGHAKPGPLQPLVEYRPPAL